MTLFQTRKTLRQRVAAAGFEDALNDLKSGLTNRFWWRLSVHDLKSRYSRTVLGPWWLTIGTGIALTSIGFVWSALFGMDLGKLFPYLTSGYVLWLMLSTFITEGCSTFTNGVASNLQQSFLLPKSIHIYRLVGRAALAFAHNIAIFVVAALIFSVSVNAWTLMAIPGLALFILNGVWISIVLGVLGGRFRDIEPLVASMMTLLFLISPIIWHVDSLRGAEYLVNLNPITHYLAIVRDPLLGMAPALLSWMVVGGFTIGGFGCAIYLFSRFKNRFS